MGIVLIGIATRSRFPTALQLFGAVAVIAGLTTPLLGVSRAQAIFNWWTTQGLMAVRLVAVVIVALGCFIAYAVAAGRRSVAS
jgi:small basic protein